MTGSLSRRERVFIAVGVLVALLVGGWAWVLGPIRERHQTATELLPVREQLLVRRQALVGRKAAIEAELAAVNARIEALGARLLAGTTTAVAASELQKLVKDLASAAATEVRSERILPPVERGALLEIPIEIAVSAEIAQLVELLSRLDRVDKLLSVQDLKVRVVNINQPKQLLVTLTLSGFIPSGKTRA